MTVVYTAFWGLLGIIVARMEGPYCLSITFTECAAQEKNTQVGLNWRKNADCYLERKPEKEKEATTHFWEHEKLQITDKWIMHTHTYT